MSDLPHSPALDALLAAMAGIEAELPTIAQAPADKLDALANGLLAASVIFFSIRRGRTMGVAAARRAADAWMVRG